MFWPNVGSRSVCVNKSYHLGKEANEYVEKKEQTRPRKVRVVGDDCDCS